MEGSLVFGASEAFSAIAEWVGGGAGAADTDAAQEQGEEERRRQQHQQQHQHGRKKRAGVGASTGKPKVVQCLAFVFHSNLKYPDEKNEHDRLN